MYRRLFLATAVAVLVADVAVAAPQYFYNPGNGNIYVSNDLEGPLNNLSVLSASGHLTNPSQMLDLPGALKDDSEFPDALTYLNFPQGMWLLGAVVQPGTPVGDLTVRYRLPGQSTGPNRVILPGWPEPTSAVLLGIALIGGTAFRRRFGRAG